MSHSNSLKAVIYAFSANLGIALAKTGAALWTGSGSLLAEAIHSYADSGNQILLLIGMQRADKLPTAKHPMGYAREPYIWSLMVAFTLFSVGGVFSVHEGWQRLAVPQPVENGSIAVLVLLIAVALEWLSLKGTLAALQAEKGERSRLSKYSIKILNGHKIQYLETHIPIKKRYVASVQLFNLPHLLNHQSLTAILKH
ncbi:MAG: hypothetical protein methR_P1052 [Methyloprofundus sp.]|nr:MAG: hypothetical protein methR_P1052 [Methyloprofundus sp.]